MSQVPVAPDLSPDLERVEQIIAERVAARPGVAAIAGRHIGSDRVRSKLVLLAARIGDAADRSEARAHAAAAAELIHAATSIHDELVDEGARRRGAAQEARWSGSAALMVGDYLFALAAAEMALAPDQRIIAFYSRSVMAICEGQMAPVSTLAPLAQARDQYLYRAGCATAALFEAAAAAGGVCARLPDAQVEALARFGYDLGLAMHIAADARDYEGDGRAARAGIITLPLIYAVAAGGEHLEALFDQPASQAQLGELLAEVRRRGGVEQSRDEARQAAARAAAHLDVLPENPARAALRALASEFAET